MPTQTEMGLGYPGSTERVSSLKRQYLWEAEGPGELAAGTDTAPIPQLQTAQGALALLFPPSAQQTPCRKPFANSSASHLHPAHTIPAGG